MAPRLARALREPRAGVRVGVTRYVGARHFTRSLSGSRINKKRASTRYGITPKVALSRQSALRQSTMRSSYTSPWLQACTSSERKERQRVKRDAEPVQASVLRSRRQRINAPRSTARCTIRRMQYAHCAIPHTQPSVHTNVMPSHAQPKAHRHPPPKASETRPNPKVSTHGWKTSACSHPPP